MDREDLTLIIESHSWIKVKRYEPVHFNSATYVSEDHHKKETEFLIAQNRELAAKLLEVLDHVDTYWTRADRSRKFARVPEFHEGLCQAYGKIAGIIHLEEKNLTGDAVE